MRVDFHATLRPIVGGRTLEVPLRQEATLGDLVNEVVRHHPALSELIFDENGELQQRIQIFVNGRGVRFLEAGLETPISEQDQVDILPAVAGG